MKILTRSLSKRVKNLAHQVVAANPDHKAVLEVEAVRAPILRALVAPALKEVKKLKSVPNLLAAAATVTTLLKSTPSTTLTKTISTHLPRVKVSPKDSLKLRKNLPLALLHLKNQQQTPLSPLL